MYTQSKLDALKRLATAVALAATAGIAAAQSPGMPQDSTPSTPGPSSPGSSSPGASGGSDMLTQLDADHDGTISKKEAAKDKALSKQFSKLDINRDGKLDVGEFAKFEVTSPSGGSDTDKGKSSNPYKP